MNIRKPIITGLMSIATLAPCKAQRAVQFVSETGMTGVVNKEASFYTGMNIQLEKGRNFSNLFTGASVQPDKKVAFLGLFINNYSWNKNFSTWFRGSSVLSKEATKLTLEAAPVKGNISAGKFNFTLAPAYALHNDFKSGTSTQGLNTIFQASYSITPNDMIFAEAKYTSEPAKNLFNTHFGKLKDNIAYFICLMKKF